MHGFFHLKAEDWMGFGGVAPDDKQHVSLDDVTDRVGHGARTQRSGQTGHATGVSKTSAVIDVVRADHRSSEFLKKVVLLVSAFG